MGKGTPLYTGRHSVAKELGIAYALPCENFPPLAPGFRPLPKQ